MEMINLAQDCLNIGLSAWKDASNLTESWLKNGLEMLKSEPTSLEPSTSDELRVNALEVLAQIAYKVFEHRRTLK